MEKTECSEKSAPRSVNELFKRHDEVISEPLQFMLTAHIIELINLKQQNIKNIISDFNVIKY